MKIASNFNSIFKRVVKRESEGGVVVRFFF